MKGNGLLIELRFDYVSYDSVNTIKLNKEISF